MTRLAATAPNPRRSEYVRPDGPWSGPSLDELLGASPIDTTLLVDEHGRHRGADVAAAVATLAGALVDAGVREGDVVAWQLENGLDAVLLFRACWRIGAIAAPIHHRAATSDCARMLGATAPALVIAPAGAAAAGVADARDPHGSWCSTGTPLERPRPRHPGDERADVAAVLFTGGSSGAPKAVLHDGRALAYKAAGMVDTHGLGRDDAVLMPAPLAHVSGLLNGVLVPGATPCKTVTMARWDPAVAIELIEAEQITFMVGPPTFFVAIMRDPSFAPERVASLRLISSGGAGVTETFCEEAERTLGARVKRTYGSTEAPTIATSRVDDDVEHAHRYDGRAVGEVELAIVDPTDGAPVEAGARGELAVRGPELCLGYLDATQTSAAFDDDGWFHTRDLATLDAQGWLTIVGRLDDVIIRGGENISTTEVEDILERHPAVAAACVVGAPDELMGERVCAFVIADASFDLELCRAWFDAQGVARYKAPERVERLDALPVLASGKPDRATLRTLLTT